MKLILEFNGPLAQFRETMYMETLKVVSTQCKKEFEAGLVTVEQTDKGVTITSDNEEVKKCMEMSVLTKMKANALKPIGLVVRKED